MVRLLLLIVASLWLVTGCSLIDHGEAFKPHVYTEMETVPEDTSILGGSVAINKPGSMMCHEFTSDKSLTEAFTVYAEVTQEQWDMLLKRSEFTDDDLIDTPQGKMMFVSLSSMKPLLGKDVDRLVDKQFHAPIAAAAERGEGLKFLVIIGLILRSPVATPTVAA